MALASLAVSATAGPADAQPYVYVLGASNNYPNDRHHYLRVYNAATNTIVTGITLGETQFSDQIAIAMAPDGALIYVINNYNRSSGDRTASVVSTQTNTVVATLTESVIGANPSAVAVSPDSRRVYFSGTELISDQLHAFLTVVDIQSKSPIAKIPLGFEFAYGVAASPDGSRAYVVTGCQNSFGFSCRRQANVVAVIDTATDSVLTTVPVSASGFRLSLSPDGRFAYFTSATEVQILDTGTNTIVATTTVPYSGNVGVSPNGAIVYAPSSHYGQVQQLNPSTHALEGATAVPGAAAVAFLPDSTRAYVAAGDNLVVMDTATRGVITTIPTFPRSWAIVTTPPSSGALPGAPTLGGSVSGAAAHLTWTPSPTGGAPTSYILQAGTAPGASDLFNGNVGLTTSLSSPLSAGTYYVRVRAANDAGVSVPSNEVTLTVGGGGGPPGQPTVTSAVASGGTLTIAWVAGAGASPTSHRLDFYAGAALVASVNAGSATSIAIPIPPGTQGTFDVRVTALNGAIAGPASVPFTFTIGPACTVPASPNVSGGVVGGTASVSWPTVAGATSYILSAGTTQGGTQYLAPTNIGANTGASASGLPAGFTAWVRVIAVNACGQESVPRDFFVQ